LASSILAVPDIEGLTVTGGEPCEQALAVVCIAELLTSYGEKESIFDVRVESDGVVSSRLENWVNPERAYILNVFLRQPQGLSITVIFGSLGIYENSNILRRLAELNFMLLFGCLNIKPDDRKLCYRVDHFWDNYDNELSPEFFEWLLGNFVANVRFIEQALLFETLVGHGHSKQRADQFVKAKLGDNPITEWDRFIAERKNQIADKKLFEDQSYDYS